MGRFIIQEILKQCGLEKIGTSLLQFGIWISIIMVLMQLGKVTLQNRTL